VRVYAFMFMYVCVCVCATVCVHACACVCESMTRNLCTSNLKITQILRIQTSDDMKKISKMIHKLRAHVVCLWCAFACKLVCVRLRVHMCT